MAALMLFFRDTSRAAWLKLFVLSAGSACANTAILLLVNRRVGGSDGNPYYTVIYVLLFLLSVTIFGLSHKYLISGATKLVESAIYGFRVRIFDRIMHLNLRDVETLNIHDIYVCINTETQVIADASFTFATIGEQALIVLFTLGYMASISLEGFFFAVTFILFAAVILWRSDSEINKYYQHAFKLQGNFTERVSDLLRGFKEMKLNSARAAELTRCANSTAYSIYQSKNNLSNIFATKHVYSEISYFAFVGFTVFAIPVLSGPAASNVAMATVSALFLIGPTFAVISAIPSIQKIAASAKAVRRVEMSLGRADATTNTANVTLQQFQHIAMHKVTYQYGADADGFHFGEIDLDIRRGEIVFITGRNGSGKSTLLKLLTGLYFPCGGELRIDNQLVSSSNIDGYRSLFAAVFSDNYLFKTLYGISAIDITEVSQLLELMELKHKTSIIGNTFSNIDLSSGQRKRIAMIALILERRPICIFDEWAADQDMHFRHTFYHQILPWLRTLGKTVIAVTHDENYFDVADKRIDLDHLQTERFCSS